jgi:hypothetical protein
VIMARFHCVVRCAGVEFFGAQRPNVRRADCATGLFRARRATDHWQVDQGLPCVRRSGNTRGMQRACRGTQSAEFCFGAGLPSCSASLAERFRRISVSSITRSVSQRCVLIHSEASRSDLNLPKCLVVPLGHAIWTRQRSPFWTDVKIVLAPPMGPSIATLIWTGKP